MHFISTERPCSLGLILPLMQREFPGDFLRSKIISSMTKAGEQAPHLTSSYGAICKL